MSIAVLNQVYDEMRRLAVAGSSAAVGDFRLKKLLPPLEQAGAKAPVFAKAAEAVKAVVESTEKTAPAALLDLTALINAILFTQGETGAPGTLTDIDVTDMGGTTGLIQTSAKVIKPLLEALTSTGSGRVEVIREAHERGIFRDLRLVKPAVDALDDPYPEIADFVAEKVLPLYGKAILPELRPRLDVTKGRAGDVRRLRLLHKIDPGGTREIVKLALEGGAKELKVAAIETLGGDDADLPFLVEQAAAKSQDVRSAAYTALANSASDTAADTLITAMAGKDFAVVCRHLGESRHPKVLAAVLAAVEASLAEVFKPAPKPAKPAKAAAKPPAKAGKAKENPVAEHLRRLSTLIGCLSGRTEPEAEAMILRLFGQRADLAQVKTGTWPSGADINESVVHLMERGSPALGKRLAEAYADLEDDEFSAAFNTAKKVMPADWVFDTFSPFLTAKAEKKKPGGRRAGDRKAIIEESLGDSLYYWWREKADRTPVDPRWLDLALDLKDLELVTSLARPGHERSEAFLRESFEAGLKKAKSLADCHRLLMALFNAAHPDTADMFVRCLEKFGAKHDHYGWWATAMISRLPKSVIPRIEALIPGLGTHLADAVVDGLHQLRTKKDA